ncbi:MAG: hypothetical protein ABMA25_25235, partial [Ilumatobacteraceae bacterium]
MVLVVLGGVVLGSTAIVWGGAWFAALLAGGTVSGGVGDTIGAMGPLASSPGDPTAAWGDAAEGLPGPVLYWACTAVVFAAMPAIADDFKDCTKEPKDKWKAQTEAEAAAKT